MADISVNMDIAEDVATAMDSNTDVAISLDPASDISINIPSNIPADSFCAEYQAVYDSYATKPDSATANIWNTMVASLVSSGEWALLDVWVNYATHTNGAAEALTNWPNPGTFDHTNSGGAFTINEGFAGNALNAFINWNWNPSGNGVNFTQNAASLGVYIRTNSAAGNKGEVGGGNASLNLGSFILGRFTGDLAYGRINSNLNNSVASVDARGMWIATRTGANTGVIYKNKVSQVAINVASTGMTTNNFYSLGTNNNGALLYPTDRQDALVFAGGQLTQTNVNNITDAYETAMDALGKGVIP